VEIDGIGWGDGVDATILWGDATTWGFNFTGDDEYTWFNLLWGNGDTGLNVRYIASDLDWVWSEDDDGEPNQTWGFSETSGFAIAYGQNFDWGELGVGFESIEDESTYWANWRADLDAWVFTNAKASIESYDSGFDYTEMLLEFDMYTHLDAGGADVLFGLGVEYATASFGDFESTWMTLPTATLAVEADLTDWATLRAHVSHRYQFSCTDELGLCTDDSTGPSMTDIDGADEFGFEGSYNVLADNRTTYGFGLGFNWGQATLDMTIGESLFTNPVGVMTGNAFTGATSDPLANAEVTLTYSF